MARKPADAGREQLRGAMAHQTKTVDIAGVALSVSWSRGVTVSTLDPESSDRGSNLREASSFFFHRARSEADQGRGHVGLLHHALAQPHSVLTGLSVPSA